MFSSSQWVRRYFTLKIVDDGDGVVIEQRHHAGDSKIDHSIQLLREGAGLTRAESSKRTLDHAAASAAPEAAAQTFEILVIGDRDTLSLKAESESQFQQWQAQLTAWQAGTAAYGISCNGFMMKKKVSEEDEGGGTVKGGVCECGCVRLPVYTCASVQTRVCVCVVTKRTHGFPRLSCSAAPHVHVCVCHDSSPLHSHHT